MYCDYPAYLLQGGSMTEVQYHAFGPRADRLIDRLTLGRAALCPDTPGLKDAAAQIADLLQAQCTARLRAAAGLTGAAATDGYSESYSSDPGSTARATRAAARQILAEALGADPQGLLYQGVG